jgi:hypothetical protein
LCEQQIRIRTKIHSKKNKNGFCDLSVTCACQPKNIEKLQNSDYSLDDINKLPKNLKHEDIDAITHTFSNMNIENKKSKNKKCQKQQETLIDANKNNKNVIEL